MSGKPRSCAVSPPATAQFVGDPRPDLRKFRITAAGQIPTRKLAPSSPAGFFFQRRWSRSRHVRCSKLHSTDTTSGVLSGNKNGRVQCVLRSPRSRRLPHCLVSCAKPQPALTGGAFLWGSPTAKLGGPSALHQERREGSLRSMSGRMTPSEAARFNASSSSLVKSPQHHSHDQRTSEGPHQLQPDQQCQSHGSGGDAKVDYVEGEPVH